MEEIAFDSVEKNRAPYVNGKRGRDALEMVLAAYESAATGQEVKLPLKQTSPVYTKGVLGLKELKVAPDSILRKNKMYGF